MTERIIIGIIAIIFLAYAIYSPKVVTWRIRRMVRNEKRLRLAALKRQEYLRCQAIEDAYWKEHKEGLVYPDGGDSSS